MSKLLSNVRIEAKTKIIIQQKGESIDSIITRNSIDSDIVFFGLMIPKENEESEYAERLIGLSNNLKSIVFVRNASEFSGNLI